jgi:hypothetical protein
VVHIFTDAIFAASRTSPALIHVQVHYCYVNLTIVVRINTVLNYFSGISLKDLFMFNISHKQLL